MSNEQILEELRKLKMHNSTPDGVEQANIDHEVEEIDESINSYNERIAELEAKIADPSNYKYNNENEERDFTIELLQESFESQLETLDREDAEYRNIQEIATKIFEIYQKDITNLNFEIEAIERRLRKNEVAVRKNIGIRLTDEELADLQSELEEKRARISSYEAMSKLYVEDLKDYGELITANNRKRQLILGKQNSLNRLVENRKNNPITIDKHQLRLDQDELSRLQAGLAALQSRKEYITYNPNQEIDKLIAAISNGTQVESTKELAEEETTQLSETTVDGQELINSLAKEVEEENQNTQVMPPFEKELVATEDDTMIMPPLFGTTSSYDNSTVVTGEQNEEDDIIDLVAAPSDLDEEREAEIEEAKQELKEKKKDKGFVALWKKFTKKAKVITTTAVALGLTGVLLLSLKSCNAEKKPEVDNTKDSISSGQVVDNSDNNNNLDYDYDSNTVTSPTIGNDNVYDTVVTPNVTEPTAPAPTAPEVTTPETTPTTPEATTPEVTVPEETIPEVTTPETTPEKEIIELEQGEKIANLEDVLNGNINEDTVISHGDEIGKNIDGAEVKDYTEEGSAQVEVEQKEEENVQETTGTSSKTPEEIKKALEEFMGGEITFDSEDNQWLDEIQNGRSR